MCRLTLVALLFMVGCGSTTLKGEKFYVQGRFATAYLPRDVAAVNDAALAALRDDLGYTIDSNDLGPDGGVVTARTARAQTVKIQTWGRGDDDTKMQINMGPGTTELEVRGVLSKIEARLQ